ncbi:MAG: hypothetical protein LBP22_03495 [Deltaproteobacteria bacterium]|jgi:hypothetical protein|nr:hypothetical protein [Deltaproteobacteria bacterium]
MAKDPGLPDASEINIDLELIGRKVKKEEFVPPLGFKVACAFGSDGNFGPLPGSETLVIYETGPDGHFTEIQKFHLARIGLNKTPKSERAVTRKNSLLAVRINTLGSFLEGVECLVSREVFSPMDFFISVPNPNCLTIIITDYDFSPKTLRILAYHTFCRLPNIDDEHRPGYLYLDCEAEEESNSSTDREILLPIFNSGLFREILVSFSALPKWLGPTVRDLFMTYKTVLKTQYRVLVSIKPTIFPQD